MQDNTLDSESQIQQTNKWARARALEPKRSYDQSATGGKMHLATDGQRFDTKADCARHNKLVASDYASWWNDITSAELCFARRLHRLGVLAGKVAKGKMGKTSSTSVDEAEAAARCAVIRFVSRKSRHKVFVVHQDLALEQPNTLRTLKRIAIAAGTKSLLGDRVCGQSGKTDGLRAIRREPIEALDSHLAIDTQVLTVKPKSKLTKVKRGQRKLSAYLDSIIRGAFSDDVDLTECDRLRALDLVLAVRRVRNEVLSRAPRKRNGWEGSLKLIIRRYRRIAIVLSMVTQGQSLEYACTIAGFSWQGRRRTSSAWSNAFDQSGVRAVLCVKTGQTKRGAIGKTSPLTV